MIGARPTLFPGWLLNDRGGMVLIAVLAVAAILVPVANLSVPANSM